MAYLKINGAASYVVGYAGGLLTVTAGTGSRFSHPTLGDPSPSRPLLIQTMAAGGIRASAYLACTGRSGDVLSASLISGAVSPGDVVAAGDVAELWDEAAAAIAAKQDALPTGGTADQYIGGDFALHDLPTPGGSGVISVGIGLPTDVFVNGSPVTGSGNLTASFKAQAPNTIFAGPASGGPGTPGFRSAVAADFSGLGFATTATTDALDARLVVVEGDVAALQARRNLVCIARWGSSDSADLSAGPLDARYADTPVDLVPAYVTVNAATNPGGGGFTFNLSIGGSDLFATPQSYAAGTTNSTNYTDFALASIPANSKIGAAAVAAGSGVRSVVIALWAWRD